MVAGCLNINFPLPSADEIYAEIKTSLCLDSNSWVFIKFPPNTPIEKALKEAKLLAQRLKVAYVVFFFKSVQIFVSPNANIKKGLEDFREKKKIIII